MISGNQGRYPQLGRAVRSLPPTIREIGKLLSFLPSNGGYAMQFSGRVIVSAAIWAIAGGAAFAQQPPSAHCLVAKSMWTKR